MSIAYIIATIADIHFGALDPKRLLFELQDQFLDKLEKLPILDAIVIAGDFYDHKLSMNSTHAKYSIKFIERLITLAKEKKSKIRIIKGTESHDNKQLDLLSSIFIINTDVDAKIISTVEKEMLFEDCHVLYLPEEYTNDANYYNNYFSDSYDIIFGHGMFKEVSFTSKKQEGEINHPKAPIFNSSLLSSICSGPILFGHIHISQVINEKIFYVGSFSRWCFGEESDKGFYLCAYSKDAFRMEFIKNKMSVNYDTTVIDFNNTKHEMSIDSLFEFLKDKPIDHLRLIINLPEDFENPLLFTNMVNDYFSKSENVKIIINNNSKMKQTEERKERLTELMDRYGFVFDKSITHEEKISRFIKEKYKKNMSIERIRYYLYEQLLK